jgi:hypothetical protein
MKKKMPAAQVTSVLMLSILRSFDHGGPTIVLVQKELDLQLTHGPQSQLQIEKNQQIVV